MLQHAGRCGLARAAAAVRPRFTFSSCSGQSETIRGPTTPTSRYLSAAATTLQADRTKPRVVVLGTGWSSFAAVKHLDHRLFDIHVVRLVRLRSSIRRRRRMTVARHGSERQTSAESCATRVLCCSPRNHMLFTPLLASTSVGTLEFRSIAEPLKYAHPDVEYHKARVTAIDPRRKLVTLETDPDTLTPKGGDPVVKTMTMPYDLLLIGVGARVNTFNIPNVEKHAFFLKELSDARAIRWVAMGTLPLHVHANQHRRGKPSRQLRSCTMTNQGRPPPCPGSYPRPYHHPRCRIPRSCMLLTNHRPVAVPPPPLALQFEDHPHRGGVHPARRDALGTAPAAHLPHRWWGTHGH